MMHCEAQVRVLLIALGMSTFFAVANIAPAGTMLLGPTPYRSATDSPFSHSGLEHVFFLENFEDGELNTPGIRQVPTGPGFFGDLSLAAVIPPGEFTDSVDADDGLIDGLGSGGHSLRAQAEYLIPMLPPRGQQLIEFRFQPSLLPNQFGFVWTDGAPDSTLSLHVLNADGVWTREMVAEHLGDLTREGGVEEDVFFGAVDPSGIRRVIILSEYIGAFDIPHFLEIDHIQYGYVAVPEPSTLVVLLSISVVLIAKEGKRRCWNQIGRLSESVHIAGWVATR